MAKPSAKKGETKVTRIKASDTGAPAKITKPAPSTVKKVTKIKEVEAAVTKKSETPAKKARKNAFARAWTYFKGAWTELRLVRWPDRKATWGMTGALILFTLFFVVVILLLDYGFSELFKLILGSN